MALKLFLPLAVLFVLGMVQAQRAPYAGSRPNGYKDRFRPSARPAIGASLNEIDNRFGENTSNLDIDNVTQRPPQGVDVVYGEASSIDDYGQQQEIDNRQQLDTDDEQQQTTNLLSTDLVTGGAPLRPSGRPSAGGGRLPHDAHGDRPLVNILYQRPVDKRPFWLVNYQAIEAHRNGK